MAAESTDDRPAASSTNEPETGGSATQSEQNVVNC